MRDFTYTLLVRILMMH